MQNKVRNPKDCPTARSLQRLSSGIARVLGGDLWNSLGSCRVGELAWLCQHALLRKHWFRPQAEIPAPNHRSYASPLEKNPKIKDTQPVPHHTANDKVIQSLRRPGPRYPHQSTHLFGLVAPTHLLEIKIKLTNPTVKKMQACSEINLVNWLIQPRLLQPESDVN